MKALQITWKQYREEMNPFIVRQMGWVNGIEQQEQKSRERMNSLRKG